MEQTFFIIKPDGVKRGLVGEVLKRIERRGFKLEKLELRSTVSEDLIDQHYRDLVGKSFYLPIRQFMTSGPIIVGIISGPKVIESWRDMMGATRPEEASPGTIRGDFARAAGDNQAIQTSYMGQIQKSQLNEKSPSGLRIRLEENSSVNDGTVFCTVQRPNVTFWKSFIIF